MEEKDEENVKIEPEKEKSEITVSKSDLLTVGLIVVLAAIILFNQYQILGLKGSGITGAATAQTSTGNPVQDAINAVVPTGTPDVYGAELSISFDAAQPSLSALANLDRSLQYTDLSSAQQQRYTKIAKTQGTGCEFCCGMKSNGFGYRSGTQSDCGCAHNHAFSALTKYLLKNHENEYTNEEIIQEIQKWKGLFFPQQMTQRYLEQEAAAGDTGAATAIQGLPKMVGGC